MLNFLRKNAAYIKVGVIILIVGAVAAYVYKKNSLNSDVDNNRIDSIVQQGLSDLRESGDRIRESDRSANAALKRAADRNRQLSNSLTRAGAGAVRSHIRAERIAGISRRTKDRNREITELANRATKLLAELRESL